MVDSAPKWTMRRCRRESDRNGRRQCRYRAGARRNVPNMVDSRPKWTMLAPMMARFAFLLPCSRPSWRPHGRFRAWSIFCRRGPCWARKKGKQKPPQSQKNRPGNEAWKDLPTPAFATAAAARRHACRDRVTATSKVARPSWRFWLSEIMLSKSEWQGSCRDRHACRERLTATLTAMRPSWRFPTV